RILLMVCSGVAHRPRWRDVRGDSSPPSAHLEAGMTTRAPPTTKGYRPLRFPLPESAYERCLTERSSAKARREERHEACAAVFPDALLGGAAFCGAPAPSSTPPLLGRRMRLEPGRPGFPSAPAFVMPARTGRPQDVDPA